MGSARIHFGEAGQTLSSFSRGEQRYQIAYLDPPYVTGKDFVLPSNGTLCYRDRNPLAAHLEDLERILVALKPHLTETGVVFVHCDWRTTAHVRLLLERLFGAENYVNEVIWAYRTGGVPQKGFARKHDTIHVAAVDRRQLKWFQTKEKSYVRHRYGFQNIELLQDEGGWYRETVQRDVFDVPALRGNSAEYVGYPTQKPLELLRRLFSACAEAEDAMIDPYMGSGSSLLAAASLGLRPTGIDSSPVALATACKRLEAEGIAAHVEGLDPFLQSDLPGLRFGRTSISYRPNPDDAWLAIDEEYREAEGFRFRTFFEMENHRQDLCLNNRTYERSAVLAYRRSGELVLVQAPTAFSE